MQLLRSSIQIGRGSNGKFIQSQQSSRFVSTNPNNRSTGGSKALIFGSVAVISIVGGEERVSAVIRGGGEEGRMYKVS